MTVYELIQELVQYDAGAKVYIKSLVNNDLHDECTLCPQDHEVELEIDDVRVKRSTYYGTRTEEVIIECVE